jgi:hypothetical protein
MTTVSITNYAGNNTYRNVEFHEPSTPADISALLKENSCRPSPRRVRAFGSVHSWTRLFEDGDVGISLIKFKNIHIDGVNRTATIGGGVLRIDAQTELFKNGLQLSGIPQAVDATIGGMIANGVHSNFNQPFGAYVIGVKMVLANGILAEYTDKDHPDIFRALRCNLGLLGIIYEATLKVDYFYDTTPSIKVLTPSKAIDYFKNSTFANVPGGDIGASLYYVYDRKFAVVYDKIDKDAKPHPVIDHQSSLIYEIPYSVFDKDVTIAGSKAIALPFKSNYTKYASTIRWLQWIEVLLLQLLALISAIIPSSWAMKLAWSINSLLTPATGNVFANYSNVSIKDSKVTIDHILPVTFLESEWSVPRSLVVEILGVISDKFIAYSKTSTSKGYLQQPLFIRNVEGDDTYMSPTQGRPSTYISMAWLCDPSPDHLSIFKEFVNIFEDIMRQFLARPHWAKIHTVDKAYIKSIYPHYNEYMTQLKIFDPTGVFANPMRDELFSDHPMIPSVGSLTD